MTAPNRNPPCGERVGILGPLAADVGAVVPCAGTLCLLRAVIER